MNFCQKLKKAGIGGTKATKNIQLKTRQWSEKKQRRCKYKRLKCKEFQCETIHGMIRTIIISTVIDEWYDTRCHTKYWSSQQDYRKESLYTVEYT